MRRSIKVKVDEEKKLEESENGDGSEEEVSQTSPESSGKTKRRSKGKGAGPRSKRRKVDEDGDDGESKESVEMDGASDSEGEETLSKKKAGGKVKKSAGGSNEEEDDKSDVNDDDQIPLSKKMKAVKKTPAKNGMSKAKRRAAELEEKVEYEVESVVGSRLQRGKRQFRIRWKGFKEEEDTWENEDGLDCAEAIEQYLQNHPEDEVQPKGPKASKTPKKAERAKATSGKEKNGQDDEKEVEVSKEEYEVEHIKDVCIRKNGKREFLVRWKGYTAKDDTWEPEEHLNCADLIKKYEEKMDKAKSVPSKELRVARKPTDRFTLTMEGKGRRVSRRGGGKQRVRYDDAE